MPGDTTANLADLLKNHYGSQILSQVAQGRQKRRTAPKPGRTQSMGRAPRAAPQQDSERVRDALRLKPWI